MGCDSHHPKLCLESPSSKGQESRSLPILECFDFTQDFVPSDLIWAAVLSQGRLADAPRAEIVLEESPSSFIRETGLSWLSW